MTGPVRLLLVGDDPDDRAIMSLVLNQAFKDVVVDEADGPIAFAEYLASGAPTAVIVDQKLAWGDGERVLQAFRRQDPKCLLFLMVEAVAGPGTGPGSSDQGLTGYITKDSRGFLALPGMVKEALARASEPSRADLEPACRRLIDELPIGVVSLTREGVLTRANRAAATMLGQSLEQDIIGARLQDLLPDSELHADWAALMDHGRAIESAEARVLSGDRSAARVRFHVWPVRDAADEVIGYDAALEQISAANENDLELSSRARSLERSNEDLEQLAYVVSHDLQEPLQLVSRHAHLLWERHGDCLGDDGQRFLRHLMSNATRMQQMVDGVLEYFRAGKQGRPAEMADFSPMVDEAVANLGAIVDECGASVQHNVLPQLAVNRLKIVQLFQNLIGNAIKFRREEPPRVVITAKERESDWLFAVKDNGIGVEPENHGRIFGMFQRLHTNEEYPGTGIGLAMCKRIVEWHGGRIWLSSTTGNGTTFYFTIPKSLQNQEAFSGTGDVDEQTGY